MQALSLSPLARLGDLGLLVLRLAVGAVFIAHGWPKLQDPAGTAQFFGSVGIPAPEIMVWVVILAELVGGILLIVGFLTRIVGVAQAFDMLVAILLVTMPNRGLLSRPGAEGSSELELVLLAGSLALALVGPGRISLDRAVGLERTAE